MTRKATKSGSISRRRLLTTVSAGAALAVSPFRINLLQAQEANIKIGFPVPLTGPYGTEAQDQVRAGQLAVAQFNDSGGLNGRKAELVVRDDKLNPGEAATRTLELVEKEKVNFVVGSLSAAVQLAINNVTKERGIIFNSISQSDTINEASDFSKFTFHEALNPHLTSGAVGRYAFSKFGKRVAFLTADYAYGHEMVRLLDAAAAHPGAQARHPLHQQFRTRPADRAEAGHRFRHQADDANHRAPAVACKPGRGRTAGVRGRDRRMFVLLGHRGQVRLHQGVQRRFQEDV
jgi:ABC-type branched-subunit amino acid transport system substrate-binding protein